MTTPDASFPIGRFDRQMPITAQLRQAAIAEIAALPGRLRVAVAAEQVLVGPKVAQPVGAGARGVGDLPQYNCVGL